MSRYKKKLKEKRSHERKEEKQGNKPEVQTTLVTGVNKKSSQKVHTADRKTVTPL